MSSEDAIVKRIVKTYLDFKGEASTDMIVKYIEDKGFGLRKPLTNAGLSRKMKTWGHNGKSGSWFRVSYEKRDRKTWWRLK